MIVEYLLLVQGITIHVVDLISWPTQHQAPKLVVVQVLGSELGIVGGSVFEIRALLLVLQNSLVVRTILEHVAVIIGIVVDRSERDRARLATRVVRFSKGILKDVDVLCLLAGFAAYRGARCKVVEKNCNLGDSDF